MSLIFNDMINSGYDPFFRPVGFLGQTNQFTVSKGSKWGPLWSWSYGSWIYNCLCYQCLSPLKLWVQTPFMARCTWYSIMWFATGWWFSPGTPVSSTNKTDCHDVTKILLKIKGIKWVMWFWSGWLQYNIM